MKIDDLSFSIDKVFLFPHSTTSSKVPAPFRRSQRCAPGSSRDSVGFVPSVLLLHQSAAFLPRMLSQKILQLFSFVAMEKNTNSRSFPRNSRKTLTTLSSTFKQTKKKINLSSSSKSNSKIIISTTLNDNLIEETTKAPLTKETLVIKWKPLLKMNKSELFLPLTFPTGQTFRWKQTGLNQYTGVVGSYLISLKQQQYEQPNPRNWEGNVHYFVHSSSMDDKEENFTAIEALEDFLNVGISLKEMWESFSASDSRFADLALHFGGARVLRQDPFECLIQFLCSSNNNIGRITKMVDFISSLGDYLGTVEGFKFHKFPSLDQLSSVSEDQLRAAGFGYRAKYIVGTVKALKSKPAGGEKWLMSLRELELNEAVDALCTLPGVGPKVAACIALFSLDHHEAIPVDTHVWQIATRYLLPELAGARLTPKLCIRVAEAFVNKYGKYAGWAQTLLFIAELPSQKSLLPTQAVIIKTEELVE